MDPVSQAFINIRRTDFLPAETREFASVDAPLGIGHQQTNSQPSTVKAMLKLWPLTPVIGCWMWVLDPGGVPPCWASWWVIRVR